MITSELVRYVVTFGGDNSSSSHTGVYTIMVVKVNYMYTKQRFVHLTPMVKCLGMSFV